MIHFRSRVIRSHDLACQQTDVLNMLFQALEGDITFSRFSEQLIINDAIISDRDQKCIIACVFSGSNPETSCPLKWSRDHDADIYFLPVDLSSRLFLEEHCSSNTQFCGGMVKPCHDRLPVV